MIARDPSCWIALVFVYSVIGLSCGPSEVALRASGEACTSHADCEGGVCLPASGGWAGGLCSSLCDGVCGGDSACVPLADSGFCLPRCVASTDCREGYVCQSDVGACLPDCRLGWSCGDLLNCADDGTCVLPDVPGAEVGAPCQSAIDCRTALCLQEPDWPAGMCSASCPQGRCGDGERCVRVGEHLVCVPDCSAACREGFVCNEALDACLPDCRAGWSCGDSLSCDDDGQCVIPHVTANPVGAPCDLDTDCTSRICLPQADDTGATGWTDGMCVALCFSAVCGDTTACAVLDGEAWCLPACGDGCRSGYVCQETLGVCLPDCRLGWSCGDTLTCDDEGQCTLVAPALADVGEPCDQDVDCRSGVCAGEGEDGATGWTDGMCIAPCHSDACGAQTTCAALDGEAWCLPTCGEGCRQGYVCQAGLDACLPDCRLGWDCGGGFECSAEGTCDVASSDLSAVGEPCADDLACRSGVCAEATNSEGPTGWTEGMCIAPCYSAHCDADTTCAVIDGVAWCLPSCDAACRPGYVCNGALEACFPDCRLGWACGEGFECGVDGVCVVSAPTLAAVGAPCGADLDCRSGICAEATDAGDPTGWTDGMCLAPCASAHCGDDTSCAVLDGAVWCMPRCADGCRDGYLCSESLDACLPDCRDGWPCGDGFVCGDDGRCSLSVPTLAPVGAPCDADLACTSGVCVPASDSDGATGWTDGMCVAPCFTTHCGDDTSCVVLDGASWCLPSCVAGCREGYVCSETAGACLPDCSLGWPCGDGLVCEGGLCTVANPDLAAVGDACDDDIECASGVCTPASDAEGPTGWTDGMCLAPCFSSHCGDDTDCIQLDGAAWCVPTCAGGCRTGYVCSESVGVCLPDCRLGWECGEGLVCGDGGVCRPDEVPLAAVGEPCAADADCESGACLDSPAASDICVASCFSVHCAGETACVTLASGDWCLPTCETDAGCEAQYVCSDGAGVCLPDCRLGWACAADEVCDDADGQCRPDGDPATDLGDPCNSDAACVSGDCLLQQSGGGSWTDGLCTTECAGACPSGMTCTLLDERLVCVPMCSGPVECPPSWVCDAAKAACVPDCRLGWVCGAGGQCNQAGYCRASGPGSGG